MKASLMDVGMILLILVGTAGADGPAMVADSLRAAASDFSEATPKYTPIPASRKLPPAKATGTQDSLPATKLAQQVEFESLPQTSNKSSSTVRSEFVPADASAKKPAKIVGFPSSSEVPSYDYTPARIPALPSSQAVPTTVAPPANGSLVLPAPPTKIQAPLTASSTPEPAYAYKPLVPMVASPPTIHLGRGILGQPTVYVPGQPVRNFFRYFSP